MARFFPPSLDGESATRGEERFFAALLRTFGPETTDRVWFKPTLRERAATRRPGFVLLGLDYGLLVLEVRDWARGSIFPGTRGRVLVRGADRKKSPAGVPEKAAGEAAIMLRTLLTAASGFAGGGGEEPVVAVAAGAVYPNLTRGDVEVLRREGVGLNPERALFREDIEGEGGKDARFLGEALSRIAGHPRPVTLTESLGERIRAVIEPQLHFLDLREPAETKPGPASVPAQTDSLESPAPSESALPGFWLDRKQTRMARELAAPRTVVYGPAGCGKTVFLTSRAQYWLERRPEARVLFTCYNASLASHLRHVFALRGLTPDGERLTVRHYHDLCSHLLGIEDMHERSPDFYAALEPKVLQELARRDDTPGFDLILLDEGQDFTRRMLEVLVRLSTSGGEITVVCDPAQDIYGRWSENNLVPLRDPAIERLVDCYRNTAPIFSFARSVLPEDVREVMGLNRLELTRPEDLGLYGPAPELTELSGLDDLVTLICEVAREFEKENRPLSDLAVLYSDRNAVPDFGVKLSRSRWRARDDARFFSETTDDTPAESVTRGTLHPNSDRDDIPVSAHPHFAQALEQELLARGVPAEWVARDFASKAAYDISKSRLTLSTVHSAKGMDFHSVILMGADALIPKPGERGRRAAALLFTGITRARRRLWMPYFEETGWVPSLRRRLAEIEEDGISGA